MRISDWSSDVCSSDLALAVRPVAANDLLELLLGVLEEVLVVPEVSSASHAGKIRPRQIKAVVPALVAGTHLPRPSFASSKGSFRRSRLAGMQSLYDRALR